MSQICSLYQYAFASILTQYLQDPAEPEASIHASVCKVFFASRQAERSTRIKAIKDRVIVDLKALMRLAYTTSDSLEVLETSLMPTGSFGTEWLTQMYQEGASAFNWYIYHQSSHDSEGCTQLSQQWLTMVQDDFAKGKPHAVYQLTTWVRERKISERLSLSDRAPFNNTTSSLQLLKKLAYLGVSEATSALPFAYKYNTLGDDEQKISLELPAATRILELKRIVGWRVDSLTPYVLGTIYYHNNQSWISLDEDTRRTGMQELIECEGDKPNFYVSSVFADNCIGNLSCDYSLEERIAHLTKKAQNGDKDAFKRLFFLYSKNKLGNKPLPLDLETDERWKRINALRTAASEKLYWFYYAVWLRQPTYLLPTTMTPQERFTEFEQIYFTQDICPQPSIMVEGYVSNQMNYDALEMPFVERFEKLKRLAAQYKISDAMFAIAGYYLPNIRKTCGLSEIEGEQNLDVNLSEEDKLKIVFDLALQGEHWDFCQRALISNLPQNLQLVMKLATTHLEAVSWF